MAINADNQGDWQQLDPRTADAVREHEEQQLAAFAGITTISNEVQRLFAGVLNVATVAGRVRTGLQTSGVTIGQEEEKSLQREFTKARNLERLAPIESAAERVIRQTREFSAAIRRAIPAHILANINQDRRLNEEDYVINGIDIASNPGGSCNINFSYPFWQNRMQNRTELVAALENQAIGSIGILHSSAPDNHTLTQREAEYVADAQIPPQNRPLWEVLLRTNARTILSDEGVSALNVEEATRLIMTNDQVRRSIVPPDSQEQEIIPALDRIRGVDFSVVTMDRVPLGNTITTVENARNQLSGAALPYNAVTSMLSGMPTTTNVTTSDQRNSLIGTYQQRIDELQRQEQVYAQLESHLRTVHPAVQAAQTRKGTQQTEIDRLCGNSPPIPFTTTDIPSAIADNARSVLQLQTTVEPGLVGREAVLKVYDTYNRQVRRLDTRQAQEATHTMYARNEMNREEHVAREQAVEDLIGRGQNTVERMGNVTHNILHGSPQNIICKLAESNTINASTSGTRRLKWLGARGMDAQPKWAALSYPRLITAFAALRKLNEDTSSMIHLRNSPYFRTQMDIVTNLLATRFAEQVERDFAAEQETDEQRQTRKAQGERDRKQRLIRLLMHNAVPSTYEQRAEEAISETASRCNRMRRSVTAVAGATKNFTVNRAKNVFKGEGSALNPLTYPARGLKAIWRELNYKV